MKKHLQDKLNAVQAHIDKNCKRWFRTYDNLLGVGIAPKRVAGKTLPHQYAVVFHVKEKKDKPIKQLPKSVRVPMGNHHERIITDVIQTEKLELQGIEIGERIKNKAVSGAGTISLYFAGAHGVYVGSNMHVLAPNMMAAGVKEYDVRRGHPPQDIRFNNPAMTAKASLICARFNKIDFGFAKIQHPDSPDVIEHTIRGIGPVNGFVALSYSNYRKAALAFVGIASGYRKCRITALNVVKWIPEKQTYLTNLIQFEHCTHDGDSGAPVFDQFKRVAGFVVGKDAEGSYALHINDILTYFQTKNL